jgi:hypothetical protein
VVTPENRPTPTTKNFFLSSLQAQKHSKQRRVVRAVDTSQQSYVTLDVYTNKHTWITLAVLTESALEQSLPCCSWWDHSNSITAPQNNPRDHKHLAVVSRYGESDLSTQALQLWHLLVQKMLTPSHVVLLLVTNASRNPTCPCITFTCPNLFLGVLPT